MSKISESLYENGKMYTTPVTEEEALHNVKQYYQEVRDVAQVLGLLVDKTQMFRKYRRFENRHKEAEENKCIS